MANIPLKTIKFPGLANTYTIPEVSTDLTASGKAAEAAKVGAELATLGDQLDTNTEDIDKLKADLGATNNDLRKMVGNIPSTWSLGGIYVSTGIEYGSMSIIRTPFIKVEPGDTIYFDNPDTSLTVTVFEFANNTPTSAGVNERLAVTGVTSINKRVILSGTTNYIRLQMDTGNTLKGDDVLVYTKHNVIFDSIAATSENITNAMNDVFAPEPIIPIIWEQGRLSTSGTLVASNYAIRSKDFIYVDDKRRSISVMFSDYDLPTGSTGFVCNIFEYSSTNPNTFSAYYTYISRDGDFTHVVASDTVAIKITMYYLASDTYNITSKQGYLIAPMWAKDGLPYHLAYQNKMIDGDNAVDIINRTDKSDAIKNNVSYSWDNDICTIQGTAETVISAYNIYANTTGFPHGISAGFPYNVQFKTSDPNILFRIVVHANPDIYMYFNADGFVYVPTNAAGITFGFETPPGVAVNGTAQVRLISSKNNIFHAQEHGMEHVSWFQFGAIARNNGKNAEPSTPNTLLRTSRYIRKDTQAIIAKTGYKFLVYVYNRDTNEYLGVAKNNKDVTTSFNTWFTTFSINRTANYNYRIVLAKDDLSVLTESDGVNCIFVEELPKATPNIQPMITFIDDDTSSKTLVEMYHDLFDASNYENVPNGYNLTGCYAVEGYRLLDSPTLYGLSMEATDSAYPPDPSTLVVEESYTPPYNPNEQGTVLKNKLLEYEIDGFEMIYHCMYQYSFGDVAHNTIYLSDSLYNGNRTSDNIQLVRKNTIEGLRVVKSAGFVNIGEHWATAYGACDKDIVSIAQMAGFKTLISTAKSGFMMVSKDGIDRYNVLRGHFNPDYADGTRTTDALIDLVDYCMEHNGWAIITTHVNEWSGKEERYSADFIRLIQYIIDSGCKIVSYSEGLEKYKGRMINE